MTPILFTIPNLNFLKPRLAALFSHTKSSHLSEAIAAGFEFRTHAALLAFAKGPEGFNAPVVFSADRMFNRLVQLGYTLEQRDCGELQTLFNDLPNKSWHAEQDEKLFREYSRLNLPFVWLKDRKRKYCSLSWDHHVPSSYQSEIESFDKRLGIGTRSLFRDYQLLARTQNAVRSYFQGSILVGKIERIPIATSSSFAQEFTGNYLRLMRVLLS